MRQGIIDTFRLEELPEKVQAKILDREREQGLFEEWWDFIESELKQYLTQQGFDYEKMEFSGFGSQGDGARIFLTLSLKEDGEKGSILNKIRLAGGQIEMKQQTIFDDHLNFWPDALENNPVLVTLQDYLSTEKFQDYRGKPLCSEVKISTYGKAGSHYVHSNTLLSERDVDTDWNYAYWESKVKDSKQTHAERLSEAMQALEEQVLNWTQCLSGLLYQKLEQEYFNLTSDETVREVIKEFAPEWADGYIWDKHGNYVGAILKREGDSAPKGE